PPRDRVQPSGIVAARSPALRAQAYVIEGASTDCARGRLHSRCLRCGERVEVYYAPGAKQRTGRLEHQTGQGDKVQANLILPSGDRHMTTIIPTPPGTDTGESSRSPERIITLSDGVFAIAITLLVLDIV